MKAPIVKTFILAAILTFVSLDRSMGLEVSSESVTLTNGPTIRLQILQQRPGTGSQRPVILTLGSIETNKPPAWSTNLLREGFLLVVFTTEYPPDPDPARRPVWLHFDARFAHSYVLGGIRTPMDTSRVIDYLTNRADVDGQRIGWLGSSTTGIFGLAAATHEPRLKAIVAFVSTGAYAKWLETWKINGLWQGDSTDLWPETTRLLTEADPIQRVGRLFPCAVLLVNGSQDKVVDLSSTRAFVEAARPSYQAEPDRLRLVVYEGMTHNLPADIVPLYAEHWFKRYLGPTNGPTGLMPNPSNIVEAARHSALTATPHEQLINATSSSNRAPETAAPPR